MQAIERRAFPDTISPQDFFAPAEALRTKLAAMFNATADRVAYANTVASAMAHLSRSVPLAPGKDRIVVLGEQFPSNVYPWLELQSKGGQVVFVARPKAASADERAVQWNAALLEAITGETALVSIEQAHWTDGTLFDLEAVGRRCREVDALFFIDATQTASVMPLDVERIGCDALVVHAYKAMLSNYGLGFMVLSDRMCEGRPIEQNWLVRRGAEDFSRLVDYQDEYALGARRFDTSVRANLLLIAMLDASASLLQALGCEAIQDYLLATQSAFVQALRAAGFDIANPTHRAANIFGIGLPSGMTPGVVSQHLKSERIHVSVRGQALRVSPHIYNTEDDLLRLQNALMSKHLRTAT
jgi:selenocysteine lyase/cysteine desulfurase